MIKSRARSMKAVAVLAIGFLIAGMSATAASAGGDDNNDSPPATQFVTIIWSMNATGAPFDTPQTLVDHKVTSTPELGAFDNLLAGTCVGFQVDVYTYTTTADKDAVDYLISHGTLYGPNTPTEPLIFPRQEGTAWKFYQDATNCGSEPEVVTPVFPDPAPPTCDADGSLPALPAETESITYTWDESNPNMMIATAKSGFVFAGGKTEVSDTYGEPGSATGYQSSDPQGACYTEQPEPESGTVVTETGQCTAPLNGTYTTVTTTTPWTQEWVLDTATGVWSLGEKINGEPVVTESVKADTTCGISITGVSVTVVDPPICGPNNDTIDIPEVEGLTFDDTGWVDGERTITAAADKGYVFEGESSWTFTDEATLCPVTTVAPTVVPICGPNNDTVTLPEVDGVIYTNNGWVDGELTITAAAAEGFVLEGESSWTFTDVPVTGCPDEPPAFSYTPTGELAYTGASTSTNGLTALAILLMSTGAVLVVLRTRAAKQ